MVSPLASGEGQLLAGDCANRCYSPLDEINTQNVKNLNVIATFSTGITHGHEGQPLVVNNTMYLVTPYPNDLLAIIEGLTKNYPPGPRHLHE